MCMEGSAGALNSGACNTCRCDHATPLCYVYLLGRMASLRGCVRVQDAKMAGEAQGQYLFAKQDHVGVQAFKPKVCLMSPQQVEASSSSVLPSAQPLVRQHTGDAANWYPE